MKTITVLLCDDHAVVRTGIRALLEAAGDMQVIGEAENGRQAVLEAKRLRPDVVVLDLAMPLLNGVEAARQIAREAPRSRVLILTNYNDDDHLRQAVEAGVAGYLMKESAGDDLLKAVRETYEGGASFSPPMLNGLLKEWREGPMDGQRATTRNATLSLRQAEILQLIAEGYVTKQIANLLSMSIKTVEKHRQALMDKLGLHNIASLTRYADERGIIERTVYGRLGSSCRTGAPLSNRTREALSR
jgi:DNA-binding NarL/FixJ family response regulator